MFVYFLSFLLKPLLNTWNVEDGDNNTINTAITNGSKILDFDSGCCKRGCFEDGKGNRDNNNPEQTFFQSMRFCESYGMIQENPRSVMEQILYSTPPVTPSTPGFGESYLGVHGKCNRS
jgi:hypothetical protein